MKVYLIGVGMGNPDTLTVGAKRAIEGSGLLIGGKRLLEPFAALDCEKRELVLANDIAAALAGAACDRASVLLSGDVGFYSGAAKLYDKLAGCDVEVIPGISSLAYFCAKLRMPWQDAALVSAHGREHNAVGVIQSSAKTFCITGGKTKVSDICRELAARGMGALPVAAGERLSYGDERIVRGTAEEMAGMEFGDLAVMLVENPRPTRPACGAPALPDGAFERGKAPMTKEEVRALAIAKLRIEPDHVVWDVGAGTGSVSVEAARAAFRGTVYAVEKSPDAIELLGRNRDALGAANVLVVEGSAPEALEGLPAPDRVFVGGSSGQMCAIVACAARKNPHVRICATAVTLETVADLMACLRDNGVQGADIVQVQVARASEAGDYHLMRAENPVHIVTFEPGGAR